MKFVISFVILSLSTLVFAQPGEVELKAIWDNQVQAIVKLDKAGIRKQCASYVAGEWGWVIGLESNEDDWSVDDLVNNADLIFDEELRENLQYGDPSMLEVVETESGYEVQLAIFSSFEDEGDVYESAVFIIYSKIEGIWKLSAIQYAG